MKSYDQFFRISTISFVHTKWSNQIRRSLKTIGKQWYRKKGFIKFLKMIVIILNFWNLFLEPYLKAEIKRIFDSRSTELYFFNTFLKLSLPHFLNTLSYWHLKFRFDPKIFTINVRSQMTIFDWSMNWNLKKSIKKIFFENRVFENLTSFDLKWPRVNWKAVKFISEPQNN